MAERSEIMKNLGTEEFKALVSKLIRTRGYII